MIIVKLHNRGILVGCENVETWKPLIIVKIVKPVESRGIVDIVNIVENVETVRNRGTS